MKNLLLFLVLLTSCQPYEMPEIPVIDKGGKEIPVGQYFTAYADGANFVVFYLNGDYTDTIYQGVERLIDRIELPDIEPLEMWLMTVPATNDSVWLQVGCTRIASVNRIRWIINQ